VSDEDLMRLAVARAREGIAAGQMPFGAVVVRGGAVLAAAHNTVWRDTDPTAHAEVNAIRQAALALRAIDLSGCAMYTTCEPCPMCLSAIHWAKFDVVYYGARIEDAIAAGLGGLSVEAEHLAEFGNSPLRVEAGPLREECVALFAEWRAAGLSGAD
jgi:guanine deaminase